MRGLRFVGALLLCAHVSACSVLRPMLPPMFGGAPQPQRAPLRERLIGLPGVELSRCMGPPFSSEIDGPSERLLYRFYDFPEQVARGAGAQPMRDSLRKGIDPTTGRPRRGVGFCEIVFELQDGVVSRFEAEGIRPDGLADPGCIQEKARRCGRKAPA